MSADKAENIPDGQICLDELQHLLEKEIGYARQGNVSNIDALSEQANSLVGEIARSGILESPEFESQRELLRKLYHELYLALTAQQAENTKELSRIRKGKKIVAAYGGNI